MRAAATMLRMEAHERVLEKVPVESGDVLRRQCDPAVADDPAVSGGEIADGQRGQLGGDQPRQFGDADAREAIGVGTGGADRRQDLASLVPRSCCDLAH